MESAANAIPVSMVMTCEDAVEVTFTDGSRIQLSPCGSNFMYHSSTTNYSLRDPRSQHPIYASSGIQQRTCFVTSTYRSRVTVAVEFRNRFAALPYLCMSTLGDERPLELYADITQAEWPLSLDECSLELAPDRSIHLTSTDSLATIVLSPNGQDFSVKFLCKIPPQDVEGTPGSTQGLCINQQQPSVDHEVCPPAAPGYRQHGNRMPPGHDSTRLQTGVRSGCEASGDPISAQLQEHLLNPARTGCGGLNRQDNERMGSDKGHMTSNGDPVHPLLQDGQFRQPQRGKCWYVWVVQTHSVSDCPGPWQHALNLVLKHHTGLQKDPGGRQGLSRPEHTGMVGQADDPLMCLAMDERIKKSTNISAQPQSLLPMDERIKKSTNISAQPQSLLPTDERIKKSTNISALPQSLPPSCQQGHLHKHHWRVLKQDYTPTADGEREMLTMYGRRVKILFVGGVIYRLFWGTAPSIEIYPGDGIVLMSHDPGGSYFRQVRVEGNGKLCELMIPSQAPPPNGGKHRYSTADLIRRAARLLQCMAIHERTVETELDHCCWRKFEEEFSLSDPSCLVQRSEIPEMGLFETFSDGSIKGQFCDGIVLELKKNKTDAHCQLVTQKEGEAEYIGRLTSLDGQSKIVNVQRTGAYARYVKSLLEWGKSVWSTSTEFMSVKSTPYKDPGSVVEAELSRIRRFNYIADLQQVRGSDNSGDYTTIGNQSEAIHKPHGMTSVDGLREAPVLDAVASPQDTLHVPVDIAKILRHTADTVSSIDQYLGSVR